MNLSGWNRATSPFHSGEQELQNRLGLKERQEGIGRQILRPFMPDQHREFFNQLPFMIIGSVDDNGWPWASIVFGKPGFITSPTDKKLNINAKPFADDPLTKNVTTNSPLGFVGIELATRRRNRMNGVVATTTESAIEIDVVQSFGNCPQYIQTRSTEFIRDPQEKVEIEKRKLTNLDSETISLIKNADTFFVASHNPEDDIRDTGGVDASHRGGQPGFIKIDGNTLTIPDFIGNYAFNTLGNFLINPKAGLLFIDFESGDLLYLTGTTEILWDKNDEIEAFRGAERAWRFTLDHGILLKNASPLRWTFGEYSPNTQFTGNWTDAAATLAAKEKRSAWLPYHISRIVDESDEIRSFYLTPAQDNVRFDFKPGQHLTIRITPEQSSQPIIRNYTLSSAPTDRLYRISVKRDGIVSNHLHDKLRVGDIIEAKAPSGNFVFDTTEKRPAVLIGGGVGITPMMSMARAIANDGTRLRYIRPLTVIHAAKTSKARAFLKEFNSLADRCSNKLKYISVLSQPQANELAGHNFHASGRISADLLQSILPLADYDFYICGPNGFMQAVYDIVRSLGVNDNRIFAESFGPSSLKRKLDASANKTEDISKEEADDAIVTFSESKVEQVWHKEEGTLLEFAENHGLTPSFGCRNGSCGSCAVTLQEGDVSYRTKPTYQTEEGEVLICCARPAKDSEKVILKM